MNLATLRTLVLVSLVASPAMAQDQARGSERIPSTGSTPSSEVTSTPRGAWEAWLNHAAAGSGSKVNIPPQRSEIGTQTAPISPSIGRGTELVMPEGDSRPLRMRSNRENGTE